MATLEDIAKLKDDYRNNLFISKTIEDATHKILEGVEGKNTKLKVNKVWVENKLDNNDFEKQQDYSNSGKTWGEDVKADLSLIDKSTGNIIDRVKSIKVGTAPKVTNRFSYNIKGNEYQFTKQLRLKPGVYTKHQSNGEISSFFNVDKSIDFDRGFNNNFKINFKPEKKEFIMTYGQKNIPLINALRIIGTSEDEIKKTIGEEAYEANDKRYGKRLDGDREKFYSAIFGGAPDKKKTKEEVNKEIKDRLFETKLNEQTTKLTLGKKYAGVNKDVILDATKKIIDINKGKAKDDDREALIFKEAYGLEDHIRDKMVKNAKKIQSATAFKLDKTKKLNKSLSSNTLNPYTVGTVTTSMLSNPSSQINAMAMVGNDTKYSPMGEGGIGSTNAVTNEMRNISNTSMAFIDPLHTPEGGAIGLSVHSTNGTVKLGRELYSRMKNAKNGKQELKTPIELYNKHVAFPDEVNKNGKFKNNKVKVVHKGEMKEVNRNMVDYIVPDAKDLFADAASSIPYLDSLQGNRGLTASKMQEQSLPLKYREERLIDVLDNKGDDIPTKVATMVGVPKSPVDGEVVSVHKHYIKIKDNKGKTHKVGMYDNFSLNGEGFLHNEAFVKKGDKVKAGQVLADSNHTKNGKAAQGVNLKVAYMPYKGYNFEDSTIVSESAAKKLSSEHMYDFKAKRSSKGTFSKDKFRAYYPEELLQTQADKLDDEGVVKIGQEVEEGDVLIAHLEKSEPTADDIAVGRLDKQLRRDMTSKAQKWEKGVKGVVTSVKKSGNNVTVNVKTVEKLKVADKLSGLHGNKHIVSKIVPDSEMPYDPVTGEHIEMTMNPIGVSNRINTSQILEAAAGKIAKKTGKKYKIQNFSGKDNSRQLMDDLKAVGLSDKDELIDPTTGKPFRSKVATGYSHMLKLEHVIDHKYAARYKEGYDSDEQPTSGGHHGGKKIGRMEFAALLSRDAHENLKEMYGLKSQRNDEFWRAMETGAPLPPPEKSFVWDKQLSMMQGAGINVEQKGKKLKLKPMTDKDILELSKGELTRPDQTYRKKDLAPMKGGLFDPLLAGGMRGDNYTHFKLPEKTLNPVTAQAAAAITNLSHNDVDAIMTGKKFVDKAGNIVAKGTKNATSGGPAMEILLKKVDIDKDLKSANELAKNTKNRTELNKLHKKIRTLKALKETDMKPTDYLVGNVLVTPSKTRPMFSMGSEGTVIMSDINDLYQSAAHSSDAMKELKEVTKKSKMDEDISNLLLADARGGIYNEMKAISGLGDPTSYLHRVKNKKGFISQIDGGKQKQTKYGFFQSKVTQRRQDLSGRSTVILNPDLKSDEIGLPEKMATDIFRPKIMKELINMGYSPLEAQKQIKDETEIFKKARQVVADNNLVIGNRAPSLHRWNMTAFKSKLVNHKSIEVPGNVIGNNFGGDFDGDTFQIHAPVSEAAQREAIKMLPSASNLKVGWGSVLNMPGQDNITGAWLASVGKKGKDTGKKYSKIDDMEDDVRKGEISYLDKVTVKGKKSTAGLHAINSMAPEDMQKWDKALDKGEIHDWLKDVTLKKNGKYATDLADKIADVGRGAVTDFGFTLGVSDTLADKEITKPLLEEAKRNSAGKGDKKVIEEYLKASQKAQKQFAKKHGDKTMLGIGITSGGSKGIGNTAAITMMPGILADANDKPIAMPITSSYSEGLSSFEYWAAGHGARGGNIKKSVQSFLPGVLTKDLMSSMYETRIAKEDPMDTEGVEYEVSNSKAISNRYLAKDAVDPKGHVIAKRNELISNDTVNKLKKAGVKKIRVQSPLTDPTPGEGISSYSYGLHYDGKKPVYGENIGVKAAHTITEPSLNLAMKAFHTGGAVQGSGKNYGTAFDAMDRLLQFSKNMPDKAAVSPVDGKIRKIKKSSVGGWEIVISAPGKDPKVYVDPDRTIKVKVGDIVKKGDILTDGTANPHDILEHKGMKETQKYLVNKLDEINGGKLENREIETVVRGVTNTTRILNPGDSSYSPGDIAPLTTVNWLNKNNLKKDVNLQDSIGFKLDNDYGQMKKGTKVDENVVSYLNDSGYNKVSVKGEKIKHEPFLMPKGIANKAASSEDWLSRLGHNRLRDVLQKGTTQGWETDLNMDEGNPMTGYITGDFKW